MTEQRFTPGPWESDRIAVRSSGPDGRSIALCEITVRGRDYDQTYDEAEANARLIAAAPELLEALRGIGNLLKDRPDIAKSIWPMMGPAEHDAFAKAHAVIAKAEGGSA